MGEFLIDDTTGSRGANSALNLPGCVSMGSENMPILKGLNDDNLDPY